jgi:hypothetical protein
MISTVLATQCKADAAQIASGETTLRSLYQHESSFKDENASEEERNRELVQA